MKKSGREGESRVENVEYTFVAGFSKFKAGLHTYLPKSLLHHTTTPQTAPFTPNVHTFPLRCLLTTALFLPSSNLRPSTNAAEYPLYRQDILHPTSPLQTASDRSSSQIYRHVIHRQYPRRRRAPLYEAMSTDRLEMLLASQRPGSLSFVEIVRAPGGSRCILPITQFCGESSMHCSLALVIDLWRPCSATNGAV